MKTFSSWFLILFFFFLGLTGLITMDLHSKEIQGFFKCPVDNLRASPFIVQYIQEVIHDFVCCLGMKLAPIDISPLLYTIKPKQMYVW